MEQSHRDLNDMAVFAEIAQAGSITGAARKLGLPKSNVSRRLSRLEERLGVQLIERNTRNNRLTAIGKSYADYCRLMIDEADAADSVIERSQSEPSGELRITASVLVGQVFLAPVIARYTKAFPEVQISLELNNHRSNLIEDGFDLAFRIGDHLDSALIAQPIAGISVSLIASPDYLANAPALTSPSDLREHCCLIMDASGESGSWSFNNGAKEQEIQPTQTIRVNDLQVLKQLALAGIGIARLPNYLIHEELQSGLLQVVLPEWPGARGALSALYPSRRGATAKVREFITCARAYVEACWGLDSMVDSKP